MLQSTSASQKTYNKRTQKILACHCVQLATPKSLLYKKQETTENLNDTDFCKPSDILNKTNSLSTILGLSPVRKIRKSNPEKRVSALKKQISYDFKYN